MKISPELVDKIFCFEYLVVEQLDTKIGLCNKHHWWCYDNYDFILWYDGKEHFLIENRQVDYAFDETTREFTIYNNLNAITPKISDFLIDFHILSKNLHVPQDEDHATLSNY